MHRAGIDWEVFPEDINFCEADKNGFRGFICEFYNTISGNYPARRRLTLNPPLPFFILFFFFRRRRPGRLPVRLEPSDGSEINQREACSHHEVCT